MTSIEQVRSLADVGVSDVALVAQRSKSLTCVREAPTRLEALGFPYQKAKARLRWAEVTSSGQDLNSDCLPDKSEADADARQALIVFDRLRARPLADRARRLLRNLGERPPLPARTVTSDLSERELQVVRLVGEGLSNSEIADRLYISPRTVTTHLQYIYNGWV